MNAALIVLGLLCLGIVAATVVYLHLWEREAQR